MRILIFIRSLVGGGAERVTTTLANGLAQEGHQVALFIKDNIVEYDIDEKIEVFHSSQSSKIGLIRPLASYYKRFKDTKRIIDRFSPDIIVASYGSNLLQILLASSNIPVIASEHNTFDRFHTIHERFNRFYLNRYCKKVVALTNYDKAYVSRKLHNVVVIPNPLSFSPITDEEFELGFAVRHNILACGRLNAYLVKGLDTMIECFARIATKYPNWDLDIAGKGDEQSENYLKDLCAKYNVKDRVHFLGFSEHIDEIMKDHSIFVLTSRSEGFGMVITEAMSMGCPCISFNLSGPSEIIINTIDGYLVESQNKTALIEAIESLINNETKRKIFGKRGLVNVNRFSEDIIIKQWIQLFDSVKKSES